MPVDCFENGLGLLVIWLGMFVVLFLIGLVVMLYSLNLLSFALRICVGTFGFCLGFVVLFSWVTFCLCIIWFNLLGIFLCYFVV